MPAAAPPDTGQIAAAINLQVRQLEAQGITGMGLANHMVGHMQDLQRIYNTASDRTLRDLCRRFPRACSTVEDDQAAAAMSLWSSLVGRKPG